MNFKHLGQTADNLLLLERLVNGRIGNQKKANVTDGLRMEVLTGNQSSK